MMMFNHTKSGCKRTVKFPYILGTGQEKFFTYKTYQTLEAKALMAETVEYR